jgi:hypothetical protein
VGDNTVNEVRSSDVQPYEILARAIPRGQGRSLANALGVSESLITKWLREPLSDEAPTATGVPNPIERFDLIFDWLLVHSPSTAQLVADRYRARFDEFMRRLVAEPLKDHEWSLKLGACVRMVSDLLEDAPAEAIRDRWEDLKLSVEELIRRREAGESHSRSTR